MAMDHSTDEMEYKTFNLSTVPGIILYTRYIKLILIDIAARVEQFQTYLC